MKVDTFACDICGVQKKEANHWWLGSVTSKFISNSVPMHDTVHIEAWDDYTAAHQPGVHLCGIECATKFVARELAK